MQHIYPDYYNEFRCISSRCRHNCCIGWEIDIDPDADLFYRSVGGALGERLSAGISREGQPHFLLGHNERCPFLNEQNLCDIIIGLGQERLCTICAEHPRFHNELPGRVESGLGLCCEEAARLVLTWREPVRLTGGSTRTGDEIILLRDKLIAAAQNRAEHIPDRMEAMLALCGTQMPEVSIDRWAQLLLGLERLDEDWTHLLERLAAADADSSTADFDAHMAERQSEYEQLLVYLVYRHFANAPDMSYAASRVRFAVMSCRLIYALGAMLFSQTGSFTVQDQTELARLFSSEIEYSDENLSILLDELDDWNGD